MIFIFNFTSIFVPNIWHYWQGIYFCQNVLFIKKSAIWKSEQNILSSDICISWLAIDTLYFCCHSLRHMEEHIPRKPALPQKSGVAHWACEVLGNTAHCSIQEFLAYNPELLLLQSPTSAEQAASKYTLFHTVQQPQPSLAHCTKLSPRRSQQPWATTFPSALVSAIHTSSPSASLWIIKTATTDATSATMGKHILPHQGDKTLASFHLAESTEHLKIEKYCLCISPHALMFHCLPFWLLA